MISKKELAIYPGSQYQPLFDHMSRHHGLTLLQGEMDEIVRVVREITEQPETMPFQYPVLEGYEIFTRDGRKVEQLVMMDGITDPLLGVIDGVLHRWDKSGSMGNIHVGNDLFLRRVEKKVWVVEFEGTWSEIYSNYPADKIDPHNKIYEATLKQINQK